MVRTRKTEKRLRRCEASNSGVFALFFIPCAAGPAGHGAGKAAGDA